MLGVLQILAEIAVNLAAAITVFMIVFTMRFFGFDTFSGLIRTARRLPLLGRRLARRKTVLVYTDCDDEGHTTKTLSDRLEHQLGSSHGVRVRTKVARDGIDLLRWPLPKSDVLGVIVLITDVTQLSAQPRDRKCLQENLSRYVKKGGRLVLGHDVIYRRSRNDQLQKLAGGALDSYQRVSRPVTYVKVDAGDRVTSNAALLADLPDEFELGDNEVVIGEWADDVEYLYRWERNRRVPLVTRRSVGLGHVYWVNSGDTNARGPSRSIARPEDQFLSLLAKLLTG